jgi:hypothetical protein
MDDFMAARLTMRKNLPNSGKANENVAAFIESGEPIALN